MKAQAADVAVCRLRFYIAPCGHALLQRNKRMAIKPWLSVVYRTVEMCLSKQCCRFVKQNSILVEFLTLK